jgi:light-regulated signal transduction histidine kinase (bacteriophytochrome)
MNFRDQSASGNSARLSEEEELRDEIAELEIANRTLQDFGALVSHDLASALRRIVGFAELLRVLPSVNNDPHTLAFLQTILASARNLQQGVDKCLAPRAEASPPPEL